MKKVLLFISLFAGLGLQATNDNIEVFKKSWWSRFFGNMGRGTTASIIEDLIRDYKRNDKEFQKKYKGTRIKGNRVHIRRRVRLSREPKSDDFVTCTSQFAVRIHGVDRFDTECIGELNLTALDSKALAELEKSLERMHL